MSAREFWMVEFWNGKEWKPYSQQAKRYRNTAQRHVAQLVGLTGDPSLYRIVKYVPEEPKP